MHQFQNEQFPKRPSEFRKLILKTTLIHFCLDVRNSNHFSRDVNSSGNCPTKQLRPTTKRQVEGNHSITVFRAPGRHMLGQVRTSFRSAGIYSTSFGYLCRSKLQMNESNLTSSCSCFFMKFSFFNSLFHF